MTGGEPTAGAWPPGVSFAAGPEPVPGGWATEHVHGPAAAFHARALPEPPGRHLWFCHVDAPALVLGSAQRTEDRDGRPVVDVAGAAAQGIDVVRRRSGGSAVLVEPDALVWADVIVGRDDPWWDDDVGRATWWVGRWWQRALAELGVAAEVHTGAFDRGRWGDRICFAGLGPGEVVVDGRKLVGVAQRRTRSAARFQTAALLRWDPEPLARLCHVPADDAVLRACAIGLAELAGGRASSDVGAGGSSTAGGSGAARLAAQVRAALVEALPG